MRLQTYLAGEDMFGGVLAGNEVTLYVMKSLWLLRCFLAVAEHVFQLPEEEDRFLHWS